MNWNCQTDYFTCSIPAKETFRWENKNQFSSLSKSVKERGRHFSARMNIENKFQKENCNIETQQKHSKTEDRLNREDKISTPFGENSKVKNHTNVFGSLRGCG